MNKKSQLVDKIIFVCKASNVSDDKNIPLDKVFMNLVGLSESELIKICAELNIKTED